jgi:membrane protein involved in colicin uptake
MKDVNDLMQAILEMDAAQRKASEKAKAERTARLAALDEQKQKIIAECDAREKTECAAAAKAALAALEQQRRQAAETMTAAAKAKQAQWCAELVQRTLGGEAAQ